MQSRRFLQSIDDNILMQVAEELTSRGVLLDLVLTNKEGLVEDAKVGGSFGCSDYEMVEIRILSEGSRVISRIRNWTSGELTLASSRSYLEESHGPGLSKAGGSKSAGLCLNITSSMLRISASP